MPRWRVLLASVPLLTGCAGSSSSAGGACDEAWQAAAEVAHLAGQQKVLHPAFSACADFEQFRETNARYPGVLDGKDPATYVDDQCHYLSVLEQTPVCRTLPEHH